METSGCPDLNFVLETVVVSVDDDSEEPFVCFGEIWSQADFTAAAGFSFSSCLPDNNKLWEEDWQMELPNRWRVGVEEAGSVLGSSEEGNQTSLSSLRHFISYSSGVVLLWSLGYKEEFPLFPCQCSLFSHYLLVVSLSVSKDGRGIKDQSGRTLVSIDFLN